MGPVQRWAAKKTKMADDRIMVPNDQLFKIEWRFVNDWSQFNRMVGVILGAVTIEGPHSWSEPCFLSFALVTNPAFVRWIGTTFFLKHALMVPIKHWALIARLLFFFVMLGSIAMREIYLFLIVDKAQRRLGSNTYPPSFFSQNISPSAQHPQSTPDKVRMR